MTDEDKKLGVFSRPDSVVLPPKPPSADYPPVRPPGDPAGPASIVLPPEPPAAPAQEPAATAPEQPPLLESPPLETPPFETQPIVDSWDSAPRDDGWESTPLTGEESAEPVFQAPPRIAEPADDFDDPRHSDAARREGISPLLVAALLLGVVAISVFLWWWFMGRLPDESQAERPALQPPPRETALPPAVAATEPPPKPDLPPLDASDALLRPLIGALSEHPQLARWLITEDLVRRFVATVDNISRGESPRPHLAALDPEADFEVARSASAIYVAPESSRRYDLLAEVFTSLDIAAGARLFHDFEPLLEEAYLELGDPSRDFRSSLTVAIDHLLAVPIPEQEPELVKGVLVYRYADPQLEAQSPAAKHLLRLGRDNARKVQQKLRFLRAALDLPDAAG